MTIGKRLTLWYAAILALSLLVMGIGTYEQVAEQQRARRHHEPADNPLEETSEMIFSAGLPAVIVGLLGGWWLTRRALAPVQQLTEAIRKLHEHNLREQLQRTRNGDELDQLTQVCNDTLARLDDSFHRIREFTLYASHELKTPLTVMRGEAETALREESLSPAERERTLSALEELRRLTRIVDGLTLLAKADAGQINLEFATLAFDELVRDNFADTEILAESQNIDVQLLACEKISVRGDRHRLRQLLLNLADNAVKYNQPKGTVTMALRRTDDFAELTITNTGAGIAPEILPRVFDRFYRGDVAHGDTVEGCGLGLSIAQWIVSAHGGNIRLASEPLKNTSVTVRLPIAAGKPLPA